LNEEELDRPLWRTRFGRGYGPNAKQITQRMIPEFVERKAET